MWPLMTHNGSISIMNTMPDVHSKWKPPLPTPSLLTNPLAWLWLRSGSLPYTGGENTQRMAYQKLANFCRIVSRNIWTIAAMLITDVISVFHLLPARGPPTAICLIVSIIIYFLFRMREGKLYGLKKAFQAVYNLPSSTWMARSV